LNGGGRLWSESMSPATPAKDERTALLGLLQERFETNMQRHEGLAWGDVRARIAKNPGALASLHAME
jgi:hypothetical protein